MNINGLVVQISNEKLPLQDFETYLLDIDRKGLQVGSTLIHCNKGQNRIGIVVVGL